MQERTTFGCPMIPTVALIFCASRKPFSAIASLDMHRCDSGGYSHVLYLDTMIKIMPVVGVPSKP
jgi:hypothetical protein